MVTFRPKSWMIDKLIKLVRDGFAEVQDFREDNKRYSLSNLLNLSFSMFHLKDASLSSYRDQFDVRAENLERIYGVTELPGDTALRQGIDQVDPAELQALFKSSLDFLKSEGGLENHRVLGKYLAVSVDGTEHYCSGAKRCPQCLVRNHRNGKQSFYHQLLGGVIVHPKQRTVFPVACEPIVLQDGSKKNDCELNASKRLIPQIRTCLGQKESILTIFDGLYINGPHIKALAEEDLRFIIGTKGKTFVDIQVESLRQKGQLEHCSWETPKTVSNGYFTNGLILNGQHQDVLVNYFEVVETDKKTGEQRFFSTWVTDLPVSSENLQELVGTARSRWKIENETFNTLKNQGYHLEHNYGHGKKNLATNFAILTFLAFLTDQIAWQLDTDFQAAKEVCKTFKMFWERIKSIFYLIPTMSMNAVYRFIVKKQQVKMPAIE